MKDIKIKKAGMMSKYFDLKFQETANILTQETGLQSQKFVTTPCAKHVK